MHLTRLLTRESISVGWPAAENPKSNDKWSLIADLLFYLSDSNEHVRPLRNTCLQLVKERENSMSTGIGDGVAIPHASVPNLKQSAAAMCTLKEGIEFSSIDRQPVRIVILILMPKEEFSRHIQTLAAISALLHTDSNRRALLRCSNEDTLWKKLNQLEKKAN